MVIYHTFKCNSRLSRRNCLYFLELERTTGSSDKKHFKEHKQSECGFNALERYTANLDKP